MPSRILKEDICSSERMQSLRAEEERLFTRLIVAVDDFGRLDARPAVVKARCFPLWDTLSTREVAEWLGGLQRAKCLKFYRGPDGALFVELYGTADPRAKKSKCPESTDANTCGHLTADEIMSGRLQASVNICEQPYTDANKREQTPTSVPYSYSGSNPDPLSNAKDHIQAAGEPTSPPEGPADPPPLRSIQGGNQPPTPLGSSPTAASSLHQRAPGPWKGCGFSQGSPEAQAILKGLHALWLETCDPGKQEHPDERTYHYQRHGDRIATALRDQLLEDEPDPVAALESIFRATGSDPVKGRLEFRRLHVVLKPANLTTALARAKELAKGKDPDARPARQRHSTPPDGINDRWALQPVGEVT